MTPGLRAAPFYRPSSLVRRRIVSFIGGSTTLYEKKNVSIELAEVRVSPYAIAG